MKKTINKKFGFSLVELLIIIAIIGVLTAIAIPVINGIVDKSHEKEDNLTATLYTSYVTKFANEEPNLTQYSGFSDDELDIIDCAGKKAFPGYEQGDSYLYSTNEEMWQAIRKSAIVSFKMQDADIIVNDNYLINSPHDADMSFIYYYLKGEIKVENLDEVIARTEQNQNYGNDSLSNYWVCLDKEAGNTATVLNSTSGNVFVKLFKYGLKTRMPIEFLENCNPSVDIYLQTANGQKFYPANAGNESFLKNNILQFTEIPNGNYTLCINASNITTLPSLEYEHLGNHSTDAIIRVNDSKGFAGETLSRPFNVHLLAVTKGTVSITEKEVYYNNQGFVREEYTPFNNPYSVSFSGPFSEKYEFTSSSASLYDLQNYKFLPMADYRLLFQSNGYREFSHDITSSLWGIYNRDNPNNDYNVFDYPIVAQRNNVTVSGTIDLNTGALILDDTISTSEMETLNNYGITNVNSNIGFQLLFKSASETYTLEADDLQPVNGTIDGVYRFEIQNVTWSGSGTDYHFYYKNAYHSAEKKITTNPVKVQGYNVIANLEVTDFIPSKSITFAQKAVSDNIDFPVTPNVTITNIYNSSASYTFNGTTSTRTVPCGFYNVSFSFPAPYTHSGTFKILITGDATFTITKLYNAITASGNVLPPSSGKYTTVNPKDNINVQIEFYDENTNLMGTIYSANSTGHGSRKITLGTSTNNKATYSVSVPLASSYRVVVTGKDSKCYNDGILSETKSNSNNLTFTDIPLTFKTAEANHKDSAGVHDKSTSGHGRHCTACGKDLTDHTDVKSEVTTQPTCVAKGVRTYTCRTCNIKLVDVDEPANGGHIEGDGGTKNVHKKCTRPGCGATLQDGSKHSYTIDSGVAYSSTVTCQQKKKNYLKCACGYNPKSSSHVTEVGDYAAHSFTSSSTDVKNYASCQTPQKNYYKCAWCTTTSRNSTGTTYNVGSKLSCDTNGPMSSSYAFSVSKCLSVTRTFTCSMCGGANGGDTNGSLGHSASTQISLSAQTISSKGYGTNSTFTSGKITIGASSSDYWIFHATNQRYTSAGTYHSVYQVSGSGKTPTSSSTFVRIMSYPDWPTKVSICGRNFTHDSKYFVCRQPYGASS